MGGQNCSQGHFYHDFLEGWDHPRPSYWVTEGGEQQGTACSYHRRHLPHPRTEQILHVKHWKGRENADESEKKWIQVTHQPVSHAQEENPATNVGHSPCLQAGQDFYSTNRGWAVHLISASSASKTSPSPRNGHPQRPHDATAAQLTPLLLVTEVSKDFSHAAAEVLIPHGPAWYRKWEGSPGRGAEVWLTWLCPRVWLRALVQAHP